MRIRNTCISIICLLFSLTAFARKATDDVLTLPQPDGSCIMATLVGDEFWHILKTAQGNAIVQGEDGYYYYARFNPDGSIYNSGSRVGAGADPADVRASLNIPYGLIYGNALRSRRMVQTEEDNIIRRMMTARPVTKADAPAIKHGLVILVNFNGNKKDDTFRYGRNEFQDLLTKAGYSSNGAIGCAKEYFDAQFNGRFDFDFQVYGPVTVSQGKSYYGSNDSARKDKNPEDMIIEACQLCDAEVDFSQFDDDGDGEVDNVFVFYAGRDEAECGDENCIWSHAWYLKEGAGKDLFLDGKRINRYACTSELTRTYLMAPIGTFCHEYTHTFGINDMYDTDYEESGGTSNGLMGTTSLMDKGNMNGNGNYPPNYNAIEREILGIGIPLAPENGSASLSPVNESNSYYKISGNTPNEYYLAECRKAEGWDRYIGGSGMLVYHIDKSRNLAGLSSRRGTTITASQRWNSNEINANPNHQCAEILPAYPGTGSAFQAFFPYNSNNSILPSGRTSFKFWNGSVSTIGFNNISCSDGTVSFTILGCGGETEDTPPDVDSVTHEAYQTSAIINFTADRDFGGPAKAKWGVSGKAGQEINVTAGSDGTYSLKLKDLTPSTSYEVKIWFEMNGIAGISKTVKFMTAKQDNKGYPYIFLNSVQRNADGSFANGTKLPLQIYNPGENVDNIWWTLGGEPASPEEDGFYRIRRSGVLKAEIIYKDGSRNYVTKEITVK